MEDLRAWLGLCDIFYFGGGGSPPPLIIPPPPPPPPPLPDLGSQQKLEEERAKLAAQLRTGRTSTDLGGSADELRGGRGGLGSSNRGQKQAKVPATGSAFVGNPGAPAYTGSILGAFGQPPKVP